MSTEELEAKISELEELIAYTWLHVNARYVETQLTTRQKELVADAYDHHYAEEIAAGARPCNRWWRDGGRD